MSNVNEIACVCVCVSMYICMYVPTHLRIRTYVATYESMLVCMSTFPTVQLYERIYVCMYVHVCRYECWNL